MVYEFKSKTLFVTAEFNCNIYSGDHYTPGAVEIDITDVTREGVSVIDLVSIQELESEIRENIDSIIN